MENSIMVPQKIRTELHAPITPVVEIYMKEIRSVCQRDICTPLFIAA
jgi:hypothetical protein